MMATNFKKKSVAAILAAACVLSQGAFVANADDDATDNTPEPVRVLSIGDETLVPSDDGISAGQIVADYYGGVAIDDTVVGNTTQTLYESILDDSALMSDIKSADVILVSVGTYDLMNAAFFENTQWYPQATEMETWLDLMMNAPSGVAEELVDYVVDKFQYETVDYAVGYLEGIATELHKANLSADIVFQTVNNPMAVDIDKYKSTLKVGTSGQTRYDAAIYFYEYLDVCLNGKSSQYCTTKLENGDMVISNYGIQLNPSDWWEELGINEKIKQLDYVYVADYEEAFKGASGEIGLGFYMTGIENLDFRFSSIGQVVTAAAAINSDDILASGDGSAVTKAYDATGERETLPTLRAELDAIITAAGAQELVAYGLCDVDGDGTVTPVDAHKALVAYASAQVNQPTGMTPLQRRAADANNNNEIDPTDAHLMLVYYATAQVQTVGTAKEFLIEDGKR